MARRVAAIAEPRTPLSKERVLSAALGVADAGGLESLSMRRLAQELRVEAMSLYHYVRGKDDIFDGIVDLVLREIEFPAADEHWKAALRRIAMSYRTALARHPWAASVMFTRPDALPARTRYMETTLRVLAEAGFSPELTDLAYHALESHIMGFTLWAASFRSLKGDLARLAANFLRDLPPGEYPHLIQHVRQHLAPPKQPRSAFEFGLDLILDGLERLRDTPSGRSVSTRRPSDRSARASGHPRRRGR